MRLEFYLKMLLISGTQCKKYAFNKITTVLWVRRESSNSYLEEIQKFYQCIEFPTNVQVQEWNALRALCIDDALTKMVLPSLRIELRSVLLADAKKFVLMACARKLGDWIEPRPYSVKFTKGEGDWDTTKGVRIMGIAFDDDPSQAVFAVVVNPNGEVDDQISHHEVENS